MKRPADKEVIPVIKVEINLFSMLPFNRVSAALVAQTASRFESRLTFEKESFILNAKSMLGLLSQASFGDGVCFLVADGEDEAMAVKSMTALFKQ